jgi:ubiquinone/menaquinone biosynthesis C-methylase UbiE
MPKTTSAAPDIIFETLTAYQRTSALKAAVELDLFSIIGQGHGTAAEIAARSHASERGSRILCDYLVTLGLLHKQNGRYSLPDVSKAFLDRQSPQFMGDIAGFLASSHLMDMFEDSATAVRKGGTVSDQGSVSPDHPMWVAFARSMMSMMALPANLIAEHMKGRMPPKAKILDVAAGHGVFGVTLAQRYPDAEVVALDWKNVLKVAQENAQRAGVAKRFRTLPGSAFETAFGDGYDLVLLTNFLHHFDAPTNVTLLRKVHKALKPGGHAVSLEFIPNEDRVTPHEPARFSFVMLNSTPSGDAYTYAELESMHRQAGFRSTELKALPPTPQSIVTAQK